MRASTRFRRPFRRGREEALEHPADPPPAAAVQPVEIAENDPLVAYLQASAGPVEIDKLRIDSPGLESLRAAGVKLAVPLVTQGELVGILNLGPRLSEQEYSADDRKLLESLASQAAPALRVAQLVREQEAEIRMRERYQQELQIAHMIQQNFLPHQAPERPGWRVSACYRPAREVGGDFYDFIDLPDGKIGIVVGDVTDKGVPAALVMASTRSVLRGAAKRDLRPSEVLERVNELMVPEMPPKMFVTCMYGVLEPDTGRFTFANAGHPVPYRRCADGVAELRARGMPLGLMEGMTYEQVEVVIRPGETVLFTSDAICEAHGPDGEMFGCPRLASLVGECDPDRDMIEATLDALQEFTGPDWDQEDDITIVVVERSPSAGAADGQGERVLAEFAVPSEPGNEREAMRRIAEAVAGLGLGERADRLGTAVAEATMNAIEHGNENRPELDVHVRAVVRGGTLRITIVDHGGAEEVPEAPAPDLEAKLAGEQTPRGWGLFLIRNMVDDVLVSTDGEHHIVELVVRLEGATDVQG